MRAALARLTEAAEPGTISTIPVSWPHDRWRYNAMAGDSETLWEADGPNGTAQRGQANGEGESADERVERYPTPQYQNGEDAERAAARLGAEVACAACIGFDQ